MHADENYQKRLHQSVANRLFIPVHCHYAKHGIEQGQIVQQIESYHHYMCDNTSTQLYPYNAAKAGKDELGEHPALAYHEEQSFYLEEMSGRKKDENRYRNTATQRSNQRQ